MGAVGSMTVVATGVTDGVGVRLVIVGVVANSLVAVAVSGSGVVVAAAVVDTAVEVAMAPIGDAVGGPGAIGETVGIVVAIFVGGSRAIVGVGVEVAAAV